MKNEQAMIMKLFESRVTNGNSAFKQFHDHTMAPAPSNTMAPAPALTPVPVPVSPDPVAVHPVAVHPVASGIAVVESLRAQVTAVMSPDQARLQKKSQKKNVCFTSARSYLATVQKATSTSL